MMHISKLQLYDSFYRIIANVSCGEAVDFFVLAITDNQYCMNFIIMPLLYISSGYIGDSKILVLFMVRLLCFESGY